MKAILTSAISVLMLAGCAGTYNRSVMPTAAASLQKDTAGCKARWTAKEFTTYSAWQACQLTAERGFARTIALTKMDRFEIYAADLQTLAAERDAKRVTDSEVRSRASKIKRTFLADCGCRPNRHLAGDPFIYGNGYANAAPSDAGLFPAAGAPQQHTPLP